MKNEEIERKYLVNKIPFDLTGFESVSILQGYFTDEKGRRLRLRKKGKQYFKTWKSEGDLVRTEIENEITGEEFEKDWRKTEGKQINKTRYFIPFEKYTIELDVFEGEFKGLIFAEVEFENIDDAASFTPPEWFGREVTEDKRYRNSSLSVYGPPEIT